MKMKEDYSDLKIHITITPDTLQSIISDCDFYDKSADTEKLNVPTYQFLCKVRTLIEKKLASRRKTNSDFEKILYT